jgi:hypothetical protein
MHPTARPALALLAAPALALAQPCTPTWDGSAGTPGLADGYIQPMLTWNDGTGPKLFVGGSFSGITGRPGTRGVARYNLATSTWSALGSGVFSQFTNSFATSFMVFPFGGVDELVVGGSFGTASNVAGTQNLARWNGTRWASVADPAASGAVWALARGSIGAGDRLYAGGGFTSIGGVTAGRVAQFDGTTWQALGTGIAGPFSPTVFALALFDDGTGGGTQLYAAGRFDSADGQPAPLIAKWTTQGWRRVGSNLAGASIFSDISALTVFDDGSGPALYAGGSDFRVDGQPATAARWDGTTWTRVGQALTGRTTAFAAFNDGTGTKLYAGGTAQPAVNYVYRLENNQWVPAAGGAAGGLQTGDFPSVFGLHASGNRLWVGGAFAQVGTGPTSARGIAALVACSATCRPDLNSDGELTFDDITIFVGLYNASDPRADFNSDGEWTFDDIALFVAAFNAGC